MKPGRILNIVYDYILDTTVQQFWFAKGRPGGILEMVQASIYNTSQTSATQLYWLFKHKGVVRRLYQSATLATVKVIAYWADIYLDDGDEFGIEIDGGAVGDVMEIFAQFQWHKIEVE